MDVDFVHKKSPKAKAKEKANTMKKERVLEETFRGTFRDWQDGTQIERLLGERRRSWETSEQFELDDDDSAVE